MNKKFARYLFISVFSAIILFLDSVPSSAIPVYARKYAFNCTMCHSNFPRLNDFGVRYRQNGYQLPGKENEEKTVLQTGAPVALRTSAGYNYLEQKNIAAPANTRKFQMNGLDILSGGVLGSNIGYFMVYVPQIAGTPRVPAQTGSLEMASVVFSKLACSRWLNLRVGRFEPGYTVFSAKRQLAVSQYEIYNYGNQVLPLNAVQEGVELTGYGHKGISYVVGVVNGSQNNTENDGMSDAYVRVAKVIGQGEGQTSGQKIGVVGYMGKSRPSGLPAADQKEIKRTGIDASLNFKQFNLALQYLTGNDDKTLWGTVDDVTFSGGFGELSYMPVTSFVGFLRYDIINSAKEIDRDKDRLTFGGRYYFMDNVSLHSEFSRLTLHKAGTTSDDEVDDFFTTRVDLAF